MTSSKPKFKVGDTVKLGEQWRPYEPAYPEKAGDVGVVVREAGQPFLHVLFARTGKTIYLASALLDPVDHLT